MLFTNVQELLKRGVTLHLVMRAVGEEIEVTVLPSSEENKAATGLVAKTFTASAAELDSGFAHVMATYVAANTSLQDQLVQFQDQVDAQAKSAKDEAASKAAASAKGSTSKRPSVASKPTLLTDALDSDGDGDGDGEEGDVPSGSDASAQQPSAALPAPAIDPQPFTL
ncbi:MAG: PRTRC system protein E [Thiobacillus sp.]|jgi:PRTRC genetic system protein E|uniref:PRTRC system protein E n=1 Tax=Hydrogenophaga aromaticivorans TaxID=2610898 RepID=A0A7Y8GWH8_9BURK|nr:PRTRC system protein E [Hydrogenophaga aromaticivorans]MBW8471098.1 PRTRC system protein E [Thiobacillus sp.]NWF46161.1 PRTRC system protein E [Hydrogenophaga aromaticivorans]